jgi:hypothetical protein
MQLLFGLGSDLLISFLADWSEINTVGRFDCALCNVEHRAIYFAMLGKYNRVLFLGPPPHLTSEKFILWLSNRKMRLKTLHMNNFLISSNDVTINSWLEVIAHDLKEFVFEHCTRLNQRRAQRFIANLWEIRRLSLTQSNCVDRLFLDDLSYPFLEYLNLSHTASKDVFQIVSDDFLESIVEYHLSCISLSGSDINDIIDNNINLKTLDISKNYGMDGINFVNLATCINLTILNLNGCSDFADTFDCVVNSCTKITDLDISNCDVGNHVILLLATSKLFLKRFDLSGSLCDHIVLVDLFQGQRTIQQIGMNNIVNASLKTFMCMVENLTMLENVSFRNCEVCCQSLYNILSAGFTKIHVFNLIDHVLIGIPSIRPCDGISRGIIIKHLIMEHNEIKDLKVKPIQGFNVENFHSIFQSHLEFSNLTTLKVEKLRQPEIIIEKLADKIHTLTSLSLRICWTLRNSPLQRLLKVNRDLKIFECYGCRHLNDNIMHTLMYNCKGLRSFSLIGSNTTYSGLIDMVKRCHFLTFVEFDCIDDTNQFLEFNSQEIIDIGRVMNCVKLQKQSAVIDLTQD